MRKKNIYPTLIIVVAITLSSAYVWYFSYSKALDSLRSVQNVASEVLTHEKELEKRKAASIVETAVKNDSSLLTKSFVSKDDIVTFVKYLENLGGRLGVSVSTNSFTDEKSTFIFDISAHGSFSDVYRFVNALELSPYVLSIQKATFHAGEKGSWNSNLEFKLLSKI